MLTSEFSKEGLESAFRRIDIGHYNFARNQYHRSQYISDIAHRIQFGTFDFAPIKRKTIRHFLAYRTSKLGDELVLRRLTSILSQVYKVKQSDRTSIVRQIVSLIQEGCPKYIIRLDIASFYETIDRDSLLEKIREKRLLSSYSYSLLKKFFIRLGAVLPNGLPRGMGLSATLSEIYLADLDRKVRQHPGVYYYARYVDDIIIFTNSDPLELRSNFESWLPKGMELNAKKCSHVFIGCRCTHKCIHQPAPCPCTPDKCKCTPLNDKYHLLEYVGYRIKFSDVLKDKNAQAYTVGISERKINKIKTRMVASFLAYRKDRNFDLLYQRIQFLTENHTLKSASNKGNLKTGIRYNYPLISNCDDLKELDIFLGNILASSKSNFGINVQSTLTPLQINIIKKISFVSGYSASRSRKLSSTIVSTIRRCWKYA